MTSTVSASRSRRIWDCLRHNRIGAATTGTPMPSPAHQCSTATGRAVSVLRRGLWPRRSARHQRPRRSCGRHEPRQVGAVPQVQHPLHHASTSEAPIQRLTGIGGASPAADRGLAPYRRSTANSARTIAATITGHRDRRLSTIAASVTPAGGKNAGPTRRRNSARPAPPRPGRPASPSRTGPPPNRCGHGGSGCSPDQPNDGVRPKAGLPWALILTSSGRRTNSRASPPGAEPPPTSASARDRRGGPGRCR